MLPPDLGIMVGGRSEGFADAGDDRRRAHVLEAPTAQALALREVGVDVA